MLEWLLVGVIAVVLLMTQLIGTTTVSDEGDRVDENGYPVTDKTFEDFSAPGTKFGVLTGTDWSFDLMARYPQGEVLAFDSFADIYNALDTGMVDVAVGFLTAREELKTTHDYILLDCPAGIERGFRNALNAGVDQTILIVTPDDVCIRDAERAAQILDSKHLSRPRIVVNRLNDRLIHRGEMYSARTVAETLDLELLGEIPEDSVVGQRCGCCQRQQQYQGREDRSHFLHHGSFSPFC